MTIADRLISLFDIAPPSFMLPEREAQLGASVPRASKAWICAEIKTCDVMFEPNKAMGYRCPSCGSDGIPLSRIIYGGQSARR